MFISYINVDDWLPHVDSASSKMKSSFVFLFVWIAIQVVVHIFADRHSTEANRNASSAMCADRRKAPLSITSAAHRQRRATVVRRDTPTGLKQQHFMSIPYPNRFQYNKFQHVCLNFSLEESKRKQNNTIRDEEKY